MSAGFQVVFPARSEHNCCCFLLSKPSSSLGSFYINSLTGTNNECGNDLKRCPLHTDLFHADNRARHTVRDSCLRGIRYHTEPAFSNMASKGRAVAHKLHAVTQVRSCIGRPWWEKRTIKALGLGKLHQTVIQKNTTTINGTLRSVKHLLDIKPITIVSEELPKEQRNGDEGLFLRQNGQFHLRKFQKFLEDNPNMEEFIRKRKKQQIWQRRRP